MAQQVTTTRIRAPRSADQKLTQSQRMKQYWAAKKAGQLGMAAGITPRYARAAETQIHGIPNGISLTDLEVDRNRLQRELTLVEELIQFKTIVGESATPLATTRRRGRPAQTAIRQRPQVQA